MEKTISIINYGMGNIGSVENAVSTLNFKPTVVDNPENLNSSDKIILPGVGSFKTAMKLLNEGKWTEKIKECVLKNKIPIFGICLGMQLLADTSEEFGLTEGLKLIPGQVKDLKTLVVSINFHK